MEFIIGLFFLLMLFGGGAAVVIALFFWLRKNQHIHPIATTLTTGYQQLTGSLTFRAITVAIIGLCMWIPLAMVDGVVSERHGLYNNVLSEIASSWGHDQHLIGPVLVIPYTERTVSEKRIRNNDGSLRVEETEHFSEHVAYVLPETLNLQANINEEHRQRGIYESLVYAANLELQGQFTLPDIRLHSKHVHQVHWQRARLSIGLSDTRAIRQTQPLQWNDQTHSWSPGTASQQLLNSGFHAELAIDPKQTVQKFQIQFTANGSGGLYFAPLGERTVAHMSSAWPHPSFQGLILPTSRAISAEGFAAEWDIPHLARDYPQVWVNEQKHFATTGVTLFEPVFLYKLLDRAMKYGLLFIGLTFLTFLMFELATKSRLHIVQYGLVGTALVSFFLVMLSLAEHVKFLLAYWLAAGLAIGMIASYVGIALRSYKRCGQITSVLGLLYAVLFTILHMEDYSLLMGTVLIVIVLGILMFLTRKLQAQTQAAMPCDDTLEKPDPEKFDPEKFDPEKSDQNTPVQNM